MGVCINQKLSQRKVYVKSTLDEAELMAQAIKTSQANVLGIPFSIRRLSDYDLFIDIGNCETLSFEFKSVKTILEEKEKEGYCYEYAVLTDDGKIKLDEGYSISEFPQNEIWYSCGFTKTQFSKTLVEHKWIVDLIRKVASRCLTVSVNDEGDYYHSGVLDDAQEAIAENGALINSVVGQLTEMGYEGVRGDEEVCPFCFGTGEVNIDEDDGEGHIMAGVGTQKCICQVE